MAGEWMKIELALPDKPEVHSIAGTLGLDPDAVVGKLIRIWAWFDKHTEDGNAAGVTYALVDRFTGVTGFGEAMAFAGWLEQRNTTLHMPKFDKHTSESSKKRALTAQRQVKFRNADVDATVTQRALPREEKRREIKTLALPRFEAFWDAYPKKRSRDQALKTFLKINPDEQLMAVMLTAIERAKTRDDWKKDGGQFIPYASTWLRAGGWKDDDAPVRAATGAW